MGEKCYSGGELSGNEERGQWAWCLVSGVWCLYDLVGSQTFVYHLRKIWVKQNLK